MIFASPRTLAMHLANAAGAVLVGLVFAYIGLNAASGCGQGGGSCIALRDLVPLSTQAQLAQSRSSRMVARADY